MSLYGFATTVKTIYKRDFSEEEIKEKFWDPFFEAYSNVQYQIYKLSPAKVPCPAD